MVRLRPMLTALVISTWFGAGCSSEPTSPPEPDAAEATAEPEAPALESTSPEAAHADLMQASITLLENLNGTFDFVEDAETAEAVRPDVDELVAQMHALKARRQQLGDPPEVIQESSRFAMDYLRMMGSWNRFMEHAGRIAANPGAAVFLREPIDELLLFFDDEGQAQP